MTQLTGIEFNSKYAANNKFYKLTPIEKSERKLYHFTTLTNLVKSITYDKKYKTDNVKEAWIPSDAQIFKSDSYWSYQTNKISLGKTISLKNLLKSYIGLVDCHALLLSSDIPLVEIIDSDSFTDICTMAVAGEGLILKSVPKHLRTRTLCMIAVQSNPAALEYVPNKIATGLIRTIGEYKRKYNAKRFKTDSYGEDFYEKADASIKVKSEINELDIESSDEEELDEDEYDAGWYCYYYMLVKDNAIKLSEIPEELRSEHICKVAVSNDGNDLEYVHDNFKTKELCQTAVNRSPEAFQYVPDRMKTELLCRNFKYLPSYFKTEKMCADAIKYDGEFFNMCLNS